MAVVLIPKVLPRLKMKCPYLHFFVFFFSSEYFFLMLELYINKLFYSFNELITIIVMQV